MIDTIKLVLDRAMFVLLDKDKFEKGMGNSTRGYFTLVQNPTRTELKRGLYKPRLTLMNRFSSYNSFGETLSIEFSVPKLLYGNNFDEVDNNDFNSVIQKLKSTLKDMGVGIFTKHLVNAPVSLVHYAKNIVLTDYTTPYTYIKEISKVNISQRFDTNKTDYRNEGHSFKYRTNSFEIIFYDKIKDLKKAKTSEKRAEEKDNALQLHLFNKLVSQKPFEVLRMEIRLNTRQKIRQILKKIGLSIKPTFKELFNSKISKKILLHYLEEIENNYPYVIKHKVNIFGHFFNSLLLSNRAIKPSKALKLLGLKVLINEVGIRDFREMIRQYGNHYWYRLNKEMKELNSIDKDNVFLPLRKQLTEFIPVKLVDFQNKMLNNVKYS